MPSTPRTHRLMPLRILLVAGLLAFPLMSCSSGGSTSAPEPEPGALEGTVTLSGTWPSTGEVRVSLHRTLADGIPNSRPIASYRIASPAPQATYRFDGVTAGNYAAVVVEWLDPDDYYPPRLIGAYWAFEDSVCIDGAGYPRPSGPLAVGIDAGSTRGGVNIRADLDLAPMLPGHVYNLAGTGQAGYGALGQVANTTRLYWPQDVTVAPDGTPFVLDWNNHRVIQLTNGAFKLIVGVTTGDFGDPCEGYTDCQNVDALNAKLNHPTSVAFDPATGSMILAAWHNSEIFRLDLATERMDLICGDGTRGFNGDEQPASQAYVDLPVGVAFDPQGRICFADQANMCVRMIDEGGVIHTIAGTAPTWDANANVWVHHPGFEGDGGPAVSAKLSFEAGQVADPSGRICFDGAGNMYIADSQNHCIRRVDTNGNIHRFAGSGPASPGYAGDGGDALLAQVWEPRDVAADANGNIYITDTGNHVIRKVDTNGIITTVVGTYRAGGPNAPPLSPAQVRAENGRAAASAMLTIPYGVAVDERGRVIISDTGNHVVRVYVPN